MIVPSSFLNVVLYFICFLIYYENFIQHNNACLYLFTSHSLLYPSITFPFQPFLSFFSFTSSSFKSLTKSVLSLSYNNNFSQWPISKFVRNDSFSSDFGPRGRRWGCSYFLSSFQHTTLVNIVDSNILWFFFSIRFWFRSSFKQLRKSSCLIFIYLFWFIRKFLTSE